MAALAFCVALAMMTSAISSIAEATDAGDWYVDLGKSESKKQRMGHGRDMPVPRAGHVASGEEVDDARAGAVQLVASDAGVDAGTVGREHRELEEKLERPVRATVEAAVATAPMPLGVGHAPAKAQVVPIHPALPFGATGIFHFVSSCCARLVPCIQY